MDVELKGIVEGLLFASGDEGISINQIAKVAEEKPAFIKTTIDTLKEEYAKKGRGITIMETNDVYHLTTKPEHHTYYKKLFENPRQMKMSQAVLETLAIIAYEQPITRVEIEAIRGVNSDYAVQTLLARSFIESVGRKDSIGRPVLFGTSKEFLTYFGLTSTDALPPLPDHVDVGDVEKEADLFFGKTDERTE